MDNFLHIFEPTTIDQLFSKLHYLTNFTITKNAKKYCQEISYLSGLWVYYMYIVPSMVHNVLAPKYIGDTKDIYDPSSSIIGNDQRWSLAGLHQVSMDAGFFIWKQIYESNGEIKSILNCGTGYGSSLAFAGLQPNHRENLSIVSLEHLPYFNNIAQDIIDHLRKSSFPVIDNIEYVDSEIIDAHKEHRLEPYKSFLKSPLMREAISLIGRKGKNIPICYNFKTDQKFDMVIIDGPPFFRFHTFLSILDMVRDDGYIIFEHCRQEIALAKFIGMQKFIQEEYGFMSKKPRRLKDKRYNIAAVTLMRKTDKMMKFFCRG